MEVFFQNLAQVVFHGFDGVVHAVAHFFSQFFEETLHRVELWAGGGQALKGNAITQADVSLMGAGAIGDHEHRCGSMALLYLFTEVF